MVIQNSLVSNRLSKRQSLSTTVLFRTTVSKINFGFWETAHLPLPYPNILSLVRRSVNVSLGEG